MSERYKPGKLDYPESWVAAIAEIAGLSQIHLLRHRLRLKKLAEVRWDALVPEIHQTLQNHWENILIREVNDAGEDRRRTFKLPSRYVTKKRTVFEGVLHARINPIAASLYRFPGITTVIFNGNELIIKRAYCFPWTELEPKINAVLKDGT